MKTKKIRMWNSYQAGHPNIENETTFEPQWIDRVDTEENHDKITTSQHIGRKTNGSAQQILKIEIIVWRPGQNLPLEK